MSFLMFHEICPEIAFRETRSITLPDNSGHDLPPDEYRPFASREIGWEYFEERTRYF